MATWFVAFSRRFSHADYYVLVVALPLTMAFSLAACLAEFLAMTLFVIMGCGSAMSVIGTPGGILQVALTFGLAITALAYSIGHYSGGHINCAVTLGLVITGQCGILQGLGNLGAQLLGSLAGAAILCAMFPSAADRTGSLGSNAVSATYGKGNAVVAEAVMTFVLMWVVLQTACNPKSSGNRAQACIAIGFAVFLAHSVLITVDGCSINPTRSLGPAVVAKIRYGADVTVFEDMWVFWVGPLLGAAAAGLLYRFTEMGLMRNVFTREHATSQADTTASQKTEELEDASSQPKETLV